MSLKKKDKTDNRSIVGGKPLSHWFRVYGLYLLATLGAAGTIITILQLAGIPTTTSDFRWIIVAIIILLILIIPLIVTLIRISVDYRGRFRKLRDDAMVRDLYPNRLRLQEKYGEVIMNAEKYVIIRGISLQTLTNNPDFHKWMSKALTNKRQLHIHLMFQERNSKIIKLKEELENRKKGKISNDIKANINKAMDIKNSLGDEMRNRLHIHVVHDVFPVAFLLIWDDEELYFEPYLSFDIGRTCPTFVMRKNEVNQDVFLAYSKYAEKIFSKSTEINDYEKD
jgi:hypothetical protein